jgi:hypothetical protein
VIDRSFLSSTVTRWSVNVLKTENINWKGNDRCLFSQRNFRATKQNVPWRVTPSPEVGRRVKPKPKGWLLHNRIPVSSDRRRRIFEVPKCVSPGSETNMSCGQEITDACIICVLLERAHLLGLRPAVLQELPPQSCS